MASSYFSLNMAVIRKVFPLLAEEIARAEDEAGVLQVEAAATGAPTLVVEGRYVHSKRDPEREAERLIKAGTGGNVGDINARGHEVPALILGFGLGYSACALAEKFPERPIIVVEKRAALLRKALETRGLVPFLSRQHLVFVLGGDGDGVTGALSLFESVPGTPPLVLQNRALTGLDEEWYAGVEERIKTWNDRTNVNSATTRRFGKCWLRNLSQNLPAVRDNPGISRLGGLLKGSGIPVFLAAAGPTLDESAPLLGEIYKRCLIVAVDTSLRFLSERGIKSDFVVSVDPQYWNFRHLDRVRAPETRLISESAVYPSLFHHLFGGIFLCGSFFPLGRFIEKAVDPKGDIGSGGSVATSAWDFSRFLGAGTVWIAGLDLAFPGLRTHFRGALFEEKSHVDSCRFVTAETRNFRALRDGQPFRAKRRGGGTILTDKRLSLYAAWFENRFRQFPEVKNYCLLEEGLEIKGLETGKVEEFLALPERRGEIGRLLAGIYATIREEFGAEGAERLRAEKYRRALSSLFQGLETIGKTANDAAVVASGALTRNSLGHLQEGERENVLKKLDAANKAIGGSAVKEITGFIFPETGDWESEIAHRARDSFTRHLEFSSRFYRALAEAAAYNLQLLSKVRVAKTDIKVTGVKSSIKI